MANSPNLYTKVHQTINDKKDAGHRLTYFEQYYVIANDIDQRETTRDDQFILDTITRGYNQQKLVVGNQTYNIQSIKQDFLKYLINLPKVTVDEPDYQISNIENLIGQNSKELETFLTNRFKKYQASIGFEDFKKIWNQGLLSLRDFTVGKIDNGPTWHFSLTSIADLYLQRTNQLKISYDGYIIKRMFTDEIINIDASEWYSHVNLKLPIYLSNTYQLEDKTVNQEIIKSIPMKQLITNAESFFLNTPSNAGKLLIRLYALSAVTIAPNVINKKAPDEHAFDAVNDILKKDVSKDCASDQTEQIINNIKEAIEHLSKNNDKAKMLDEILKKNLKEPLQFEDNEKVTQIVNYVLASSLEALKHDTHQPTYFDTVLRPLFDQSTINKVHKIRSHLKIEKLSEFDALLNTSIISSKLITSISQNIHQSDLFNLKLNLLFKLSSHHDHLTQHQKDTVEGLIAQHNPEQLNAIINQSYEEKTESLRALFAKSRTKFEKWVDRLTKIAGFFVLLLAVLPSIFLAPFIISSAVLYTASMMTLTGIIIRQVQLFKLDRSIRFDTLTQKNIEKVPSKMISRPGHSKKPTSLISTKEVLGDESEKREDPESVFFATQRK
ncbi:hypothetical protein N9Y17_01630 [Gammaproteobacteria bacterium]|nr:hypothetical protein [Gammaproteobacteria bacterium]